MSTKFTLSNDTSCSALPFVVPELKVASLFLDALYNTRPLTPVAPNWAGVIRVKNE